LNVTGNLDIASPTPVNAANAASDFHVGGLTGSGTIANGGSIVRWLFVNQTSATPETFSGVLQNGGSAGLGLTKTGTGVLNLNGVNTYTDVTTLAGGTLNVGSAGAITSSTGAQIIVGNTAAVNATLGIAGSVSANDTAVGQFGSSLIVGTVANAVGAVNMTGGTLTTAEQIGLGNGAGAAGNGASASFVQSGGSATAGSFVVVGFNNDHSLYSMSGNSTLFLNNNLITVAAGGTGSIGEMDLSGNASVNSTATTGNGATLGGIFVGETGTLNVMGNATMTLNGWGLRVGHDAGASGTVNLDGGVVTTTSVSLGGATTGVINFNGGTLRASGNNAAFMPNLTTATIYSGGLTIDSNGNAITVAQTLQGATGDGVTNPAGSITVTGSGFIAPPLVQVSGGSGTGATAIATIDSSGNLTGIQITNPGSGYAPGDIVNFNLVAGTNGGGTGGSITTNFSNVAPNAQTGGLTKIGAGTLTLSSATGNTYTGPTTVNQGTLAMGAANEISDTSQLILGGGTFATGGFSQDFTASAATLKLTASSTIDFNTSVNPQVLKLANSNGLWTNGAFLRVSDWTGTPVTGGASDFDQLLIGTNSSGLSSTQLADIHFTGFLTGAVYSSADPGEVVPASTTTLMLGDVNQNHHVDAADILAFEKALANLTAYNTTHGFDSLDDSDVLDINHDGTINNADLQALVNLLAGGGGSTSSVPEPTSIVLFGLGGLAMLYKGIRRKACRKQS
jgi:autotransporter-associated beta strand protein